MLIVIAKRTECSRQTDRVFDRRRVGFFQEILHLLRAKTVQLSEFIEDKKVPRDVNNMMRTIGVLYNITREEKKEWKENPEKISLKVTGQGTRSCYLCALNE